MTTTIDLSPEQERRLAERAARSGQGIAAYVLQLIDRDLYARDIDAILAPVRRAFEASGMIDEDLSALIEGVREEIWQEQQSGSKETPPA